MEIGPVEFIDVFDAKHREVLGGLVPVAGKSDIRIRARCASIEYGIHIVSAGQADRDDVIKANRIRILKKCIGKLNRDTTVHFSFRNRNLAFGAECIVGPGQSMYRGFASCENHLFTKGFVDLKIKYAILVVFIHPAHGHRNNETMSVVIRVIVDVIAQHERSYRKLIRKISRRIFEIRERRIAILTASDSYYGTDK